MSTQSEAFREGYERAGESCSNPACVETTQRRKTLADEVAEGKHDEPHP